MVLRHGGGVSSRRAWVPHPLAQTCPEMICDSSSRLIIHPMQVRDEGLPARPLLPFIVNGIWNARRGPRVAVTDHRCSVIGWQKWITEGRRLCMVGSLPAQAPCFLICRDVNKPHHSSRSNEGINLSIRVLIWRHHWEMVKGWAWGVVGNSS